jgi:hypothetical protein
MVSEIGPAGLSRPHIARSLTVRVHPQAELQGSAILWRNRSVFGPHAADPSHAICPKVSCALVRHSPHVSPTLEQARIARRARLRRLCAGVGLEHSPMPHGDAGRVVVPWQSLRSCRRLRAYVIRELHARDDTKLASSVHHWWAGSRARCRCFSVPGDARPDAISPASKS